MPGKTKSRKIREQRRHLGSVCILLIVLAVFGVSAIGSFQLKKKNRAYEAREKALEEAIADEEERAKEIEELETYTKTKKYVEDVAKDKLGLVYEDEIIFKADN